MPTKFILTIIVFLSFTSVVDSSHFLGGTINWRIRNSTTASTSVAILITQTYSWVYANGTCDNGAIASNLPVSSAIGAALTCTPSCPTGFGNVSTTPYCTDVSPLNEIAIGQRSDTVVIPEGSNFSAIYASGSWGGLTTAASLWSILTHINLVRRSDNGMFNNAPVATIMSPINIEQNQRTPIIVSVSDAEGDTIRCRWATKTNGVDECRSVCPPGALPVNTLIHPNCTVEITGITIGARYAVALMVSFVLNALQAHFIFVS